MWGSFWGPSHTLLSPQPTKPLQAHQLPEQTLSPSNPQLFCFEYSVSFPFPAFAGNYHGSCSSHMTTSSTYPTPFSCSLFLLPKCHSPVYSPVLSWGEGHTEPRTRSSAPGKLDPVPREDWSSDENQALIMMLGHPFLTYPLLTYPFLALLQKDPQDNLLTFLYSAHDPVSIHSPSATSSSEQWCPGPGQRSSQDGREV